MRTKLILAAALPLLTIGVVAGWHAINRPSQNQLGDTLRGFGYLPLSMPTSKMGLGSLYYVDSKVRYFDLVCAAKFSDLEDAVDTATGADLRMDSLSNGQFESTIKLDLGWLLNGGASAKGTQAVHFSLTDITVESISHEKSIDLFISMAERPSCGRAIAEALNSGGYVCQGVKVLQATAEYKLDRDTQNKLTAGTTQANDVKGLVKQAVETQSGHEVVEREGRLQSGKKLKYGVVMKPNCMSPTTARFARMLPESVFGRWTNYVLFNLIEPFWPSREEQIRSAEAPMRVATTD